MPIPHQQRLVQALRILPLLLQKRGQVLLTIPRRLQAPNIVHCRSQNSMREEQRQEGFLPPKKKKKKTLGKSAVPAKSVDVPVKVGIASQADGVFKSRRGKMHSITVRSNAYKREIIGKAIAMHSSFDQTFNGTIPYTLLFPDFSEVNVVPGTKEPFVLSSYKQAISKDYKRLTFCLIPLDEFANRCDDTGNSSTEECENEGGLTKWLSGREPKQTVVVSNSDEAHFDAITNLGGGCFIQPLILACTVREPLSSWVRQ